MHSQLSKLEQWCPEKALMHSELSKVGKVSPEKVLIQSREGAHSQQRRGPFKPETELTHS